MNKPMPFSVAALAAALAVACGAEAPTNESAPATVPTETAAAPAAPARLTFTRACDGSAGVALPGGRVAVANDDKDVIGLYGTAGGVPTEADFQSFLGGVGNADDESDIEGGTRIGDTIYWIASHGTDGDGNPAPKRRVFFAAKIGGDGLQPHGKPYRDLLDDLASGPATAGLNLGAAGQIGAEVKDGLNIEGLAATPEGHLLIGFRNPQPGGALIVELLNPAEVVGGEAAKFGMTVHKLDLGEGQGIRSLEWSPREQAYLIAAGPVADEGGFALFSWVPGQKPRPTGTAVPGGIRPESVVLLDDGSQLLLSDDGDVKPDGKKKCKKMEEKEKSFQAVLIPAAP